MSRAFAAQCPLCGAPVRWRQDEPIANSGVGVKPPVCPQCAASAARMIYDQDPEKISRAWSSLDPAYTRDEGIMALPVRLRAHPYFRGRGVTICIMDSDFVLHPDLVEPTSRVVCYVDASAERVREGVNPPPAHDGSWHGTMTSVVAAGNGYLSEGRYRGMAPDARLVLVRISDRQGRIKERDIVRGLRWLLRRGAHYGVRVVNLSLGGDDSLPSGLSEVDRAIEDLVASGIVVVAAAGNSGSRSLTPPASARSAITVGGLDDQGSLDPRARAMWHSNYGPTRDGVLKPDLIAPSLWVPAPIVPETPVAKEALFLDELGKQDPESLVGFLTERFQREQSIEKLTGLAPKQALFPKDLLTATPEEIWAYAKKRRTDQKLLSAYYQHVDGTSFAAPAVSGTVAQMLEADPTLTPAKIKKILQQTASPLPGVPREAQGHGVVQPGRAVLGALRASQPEGRVSSPKIDSDHVIISYRDPERRTERAELSCSAVQWKLLDMIESAPGVFSIALPRPKPGTYAYKLRLDGHRWREDPENSERVSDGYGGWNSMFVI